MGFPTGGFPIFRENSDYFADPSGDFRVGPLRGPRKRRKGLKKRPNGKNPGNWENSEIAMSQHGA